MGPKTELGGVKAGFFRPAYQVGIAGVVKMAPIPPAPSQATIPIINLIISVQLIYPNCFEGVGTMPSTVLSILVSSHRVVN